MIIWINFSFILFHYHSYIVDVLLRTQRSYFHPSDIIKHATNVIKNNWVAVTRRLNVVKIRNWNFSAQLAYLFVLLLLFLIYLLEIFYLLTILVWIFIFFLEWICKCTDLIQDLQISNYILWKWKHLWLWFIPIFCIFFIKKGRQKKPSETTSILAYIYSYNSMWFRSLFLK